MSKPAICTIDETLRNYYNEIGRDSICVWEVKIMNGTKGKNLKYLRENNTREVLKHLALHGDCSRIKLSKELGLSKMTITNIVNDLQNYGYICESGEIAKENVGSTGPKPIMLSIQQNKILAIGIYVSREKFICSLSDIARGELYVTQMKVDLDTIRETFIEDICTLVQKALCYDASLHANIIGIGIATVGLVDIHTGTMIRSTDFLGNDKIEVKEILEQRFHIPVFASNDMQAAVIGEQLYGYGRGCSNCLYLGITYGLGAAVISEGKLITGNRGFATEAGHMSIDYQGELCDCGNRGCLELYASVPVLLRKSHTSSIDELIEAYEREEEKAVKVIKEFINAVTIGLISLNNIFNVEIVIFGHEGSVMPNSILGEIEERVNAQTLNRSDKKLHIVSSTFGPLAGLRGATSIVFKRFFDGEIAIEELKRTITEEFE